MNRNRPVLNNPEPHVIHELKVKFQLGSQHCHSRSGFADPKGGCHRRCRWRCRLVGSQIQKGAVTQGVAGGVVWCVWVRVRRSKRGLSHKVSLEVSSEAGAVTEGVAGGVVWCVWGQKGAVIEGVVGGVAWCVGVRVRRSKRGLSDKVSLEVSSGVCGGQGSQIQKGAVTEGVVGGVAWCMCGGQGSQIQKRGLSHKVSLEVSSGVCGGQGSRRGCHRGCRWRCRLVCVWGSGFAGLSRVSLEVLPGVWVTVLRIGFLNCMVGWGGVRAVHKEHN